MIVTRPDCYYERNRIDGDQGSHISRCNLKALTRRAYNVQHDAGSASRSFL